MEGWEDLYRRVSSVLFNLCLNVPASSRTFSLSVTRAPGGVTINGTLEIKALIFRASHNARKNKK